MLKKCRHAKQKAFPGPEQKWVRKPSWTSQEATNGLRRPRDKGTGLPSSKFFSPHPTSRPFPPTFLIISGQTEAPSAAGEYCFWRLLPVSFHNWGPFGGKWELLSSAASGVRPPPVSALLPRTGPKCRGQEASGCNVPDPNPLSAQAAFSAHHRQAPSLLSKKGHSPGHCWYQQQHSRMMKLMASELGTLGVEWMET